MARATHLILQTSATTYSLDSGIMGGIAPFGTLYGPGAVSEPATFFMAAIALPVLGWIANKKLKAAA